jgi:hypothetical protein
VLRFTTATRIWPTNNISERGVRPLKPSRRSPAAWPATTSPRTAWTSGATSTQPASTARTPWTPRTTSCSAGPGDRQHKRSPSPPAWFGELDGLADEKFRERIMWLSFRDLAEAIGKLIADPGRSPASRPILLSELVALYEADGLLSADDTVVVAARAAVAGVPVARGIYLPAQPVVPRRPEVLRLLRRRRHPAAHTAHPRVPRRRPFHP